MLLWCSLLDVFRWAEVVFEGFKGVVRDFEGFEGHKKVFFFHQKAVPWGIS